VVLRASQGPVRPHAGTSFDDRYSVGILSTTERDVGDERGDGER
jgi:hypothetical protein